MRKKGRISILIFTTLAVIMLAVFGLGSLCSMDMSKTTSNNGSVIVEEPISPLSEIEKKGTLLSNFQKEEYKQNQDLTIKAETSSAYKLNSWGYDLIGTKHYLENHTMNLSDTYYVAVIDSGIIASHDYLDGRVLTESTLKGKNLSGVDNSIFDNCNVDALGSGTAMAGIIVENTPSNVQIIPIKLFDTSPEASIDNLINAYKQVLEMRKTLPIVACCIGGSGYGTSDELASWVGQGLENGMMTIASAGHSNYYSEEFFPGNIDGVLTTTSISKHDNGYLYTGTDNNFGSNIDIALPGDHVLTTGNDSTNPYIYMSGDCIPTAYAGAIVALLANKYPASAITRDDIEEIRGTITNANNVYDLGNTDKDKDDIYGYGVPCLAYIDTGKFAINIEGSTCTTTIAYASVGCDQSLDFTYNLIYTQNGSRPSLINGTVIEGIANYNLYSFNRINGGGTLRCIIYKYDEAGKLIGHSDEGVISINALGEYSIGGSNGNTTSTAGEGFTINSSGIITSYVGGFDIIHMPTTIGTTTVKGFASGVFKGQEINQFYITDGSEISINEPIFEGCATLQTLELDVKNYTKVAKNCYSLKTLKLNGKAVSSPTDTVIDGAPFLAGTKVALGSEDSASSLKFSGSKTFEGCLNLSSLSFSAIQDGTKLIIPEYSLQYFSKLENVTITSPSGKLIQIGDYAFDHCTKLGNIYFAANIEKIGNYSYYGCESITGDLDFGALKEIGEFAFYGCTGIENVDCARLTTVGQYAFVRCTSLGQVSMPSLTTLASAFMESGITSFSAYSLTVIPDNNFYSCTRLSSVTADNLEEIKSQAFYNCTALKIVSFIKLKTIGQNAFYGAGLIGFYSATVETVNEQAFANCSELQFIEIPNVKTIGRAIFIESNNIEYIMIGPGDGTNKLPSIERDSFGMSRAGIDNILANDFKVYSYNPSELKNSTSPYYYEASGAKYRDLTLKLENVATNLDTRTINFNESGYKVKVEYFKSTTNTFADSDKVLTQTLDKFTIGQVQSYNFELGYYYKIRVTDFFGNTLETDTINLKDVYTINFYYGYDFDEKQIDETGGKIYQTISVMAGQTYTAPENPTIEPDKRYSYTFYGWKDMLTDSVYKDLGTPIATSNENYMAVYTTTDIKYIITWKAGDDVLKEEEVTYETIPSYTGDTPTKESTREKTFTFDHWDDLSPITADRTINAVFSEEDIYYYVRWYYGYDRDNSGTVGDIGDRIIGKDLKYNGIIVGVYLDGHQYTKDGIRYTFSAWDKDVHMKKVSEVYDLFDSNRYLNVTAHYTPEVLSYTVTWKNEDGTILDTETDYHWGETPTYKGATPTKPETAEFTFTFSGWKINGEGELLSPNNLPEIEGNIVFVAQFSETKRSYVVTWIDGDGNTLYSESVEYGTPPAYDSSKGRGTPTKSDDEDNGYYYTFKNEWSPAITSDTIVTGDISYTAQFERHDITYRVIHVYDDYVDGKDVKNTFSTVNYTFTQVMSVENFFKEFVKLGTTYTFKEWKANVNGKTPQDFKSEFLDAEEPHVKVWTIEADYTRTGIEYTITWIYDNGEEEVRVTDAPYYYGDTPDYTRVFTSDPQRDPTVDKVFTFIGWKPALAPVTEDAIYTAEFDSSVRKYKITWDPANGSQPIEVYEDYGTLPTEPSAPTKASDTINSYAFAGWSPDVQNVTGEQVYTAQYTETLIEYIVEYYDTIYEDGVLSNPLVFTQTYNYYEEFNMYDGYNGHEYNDQSQGQHYTFSRWSDELGGNLEDINGELISNILNKFTNLYLKVYAEYDHEVAKYKVKWFKYREFNSTEKVLIYETECEHGSIPEFDPDFEVNGIPVGEPTMPSTVSHTYTFSGWYPIPERIEGPMEFIATFDEDWRKYTITWFNWDGQDPLYSEDVNYGSWPNPEGKFSEPERPNDETFSYRFKGWNTGWEPAFARVESNQEYIAQYDFTYIDYTIRFHYGYDQNKNGKDDDIVIINGEEAIYTGHYDDKKFVTIPDLNGHNYEDRINGFKYTFDGWDPDVVNKTIEDLYPLFNGGVILDVKATYSQEDIYYDITWQYGLNSDGEVVQSYTARVRHGIMPVYDIDTYGTPTRESDVEKDWEWLGTKSGYNGWDKPITSAEDNIIYRAVFQATVRKYEVKWIDGNGETLYIEKVDYGTKPEFKPELSIYKGEDPKKDPETEWAYVWTGGWTPEVKEVRGEASYTAAFSRVTRKYRVTWLNGDGEEFYSEDIDYGTSVTECSKKDSVPTKKGGGYYHYKFIRWNELPITVDGDKTVTSFFKDYHNVTHTDTDTDYVDLSLLISTLKAKIDLEEVNPEKKLRIRFTNSELLLDEESVKAIVEKGNDEFDLTIYNDRTIKPDESEFINAKVYRVSATLDGSAYTKFAGEGELKLYNIPGLADDPKVYNMKDEKLSAYENFSYLKGILSIRCNQTGVFVIANTDEDATLIIIILLILLILLIAIAVFITMFKKKRIKYLSEEY